MVRSQLRNIVSVADLSADALDAILAAAQQLRHAPYGNALAGHSLALIFEKPSLRTRVSFELAMHELGGYAVVLRPDEIQMGKRESIRDIAIYLSRNVTVAALRVFSHTTLDQFARHADVPVINALSDLEHPCQALADVLTVLQHKQRLAGVRLTYLGDGNNVCHSLLLAGALTGMHITVACPPDYAPAPDVIAQARRLGAERDARLCVVHDADAAVVDADVLYTDVWTSMGQEDEAARRRECFHPFQLNAARLAAAPNAIVLHCLPAHRGEEITDEVMESPQSVVFDQAENRRHAQKAALLYVLGINLEPT
jgi:ornithine carbamoyltransferase